MLRHHPLVLAVVVRVRRGHGLVGPASGWLLACRHRHLVLQLLQHLRHAARRHLGRRRLVVRGDVAVTAFCLAALATLLLAHHRLLLYLSSHDCRRFCKHPNGCQVRLLSPRRLVQNLLQRRLQALRRRLGRATWRRLSRGRDRDAPQRRLARGGCRPRGGRGRRRMA